jgi:branched-subunit amino acid transport protein
MSPVLALALAGASTYVLRAGSVRMFNSTEVPLRVDRALRHAAVGVMATLIVTSLASRPSIGALTAPEVAGLLVAVVAARRTTNTTVVMAAGLTAYVIVDVATRLL